MIIPYHNHDDDDDDDDDWRAINTQLILFYFLPFWYRLNRNNKRFRLFLHSWHFLIGSVSFGRHRVCVCDMKTLTKPTQFYLQGSLSLFCFGP